MKSLDIFFTTSCFDLPTRSLYLQEAWETARSFVGGLDLTVRLLKSDDLEVSTSAHLFIFYL